MSWTTHVKPGQVLKITKMVGYYDHQLDVSEEHPVWGIILDHDSMMVFSKIDQRGYPNANGDSWVSRVMSTSDADESNKWADADEVPDDVPQEFWTIAARASLDGGV